MSLDFGKLNFDLYLKSGVQLAINEGHDQLKKAGWEPTDRYHSKDRAWIWKRGDADIRYDVTHKFDWLVSIGECDYGMDGNIETMTKDVDKMLLVREELILEKKEIFFNTLHLVGYGQGFSDEWYNNNGVS